MAQATRCFCAGAIGVVTRRPLGARGIAGKDETKDLAVLGPNQRALLRIVEHGAHRALQVRPLRRDRAFDRPVARQPIERGMKGNVSLDEGQDRSTRPQGEPGCEGPLRRPPLGHVDHTLGNPLGSKPGRQRIERRSDLVKLANAGGIDRAHGQSASTAFLDEFLLLEQLQGMADRLARHTEHPAELFLADTLAGGKRAVGNRLDQPLIGAVDQRRLWVER